MLNKPKVARVILVLISFLLLGSSKEQTSNVEGIWFAAYAHNPSDQSYYYFWGWLYHFQGDSLKLVSIHPQSLPETDSLGTITVRKFRLGIDKTDSVISFDDKRYSINYKPDSITLRELPQSNDYIVLKRMDMRLARQPISVDAIKGCYEMSGKHYSETYCFVSDTKFVKNRDDLNSTCRKWSIVTYEGLNFLDIDDLGLWVIKSAEGNLIKVVPPLRAETEVSMHAVRSKRNYKKKLIGNWKEIGGTTGIPDIKVEKKDLKYSMSIDMDSIQIKYGRIARKFKWEITADGKAIYFTGAVPRVGCALMIENLNSNVLTLNLHQYYFDKPGSMKLRRDN